MGFRHACSSVFAAAAVLVAMDAEHAMAVDVTLDAATRHVVTDSDPSGLNNSVSLGGIPGPVAIEATGDASFGSLTGQIYNSAVVSYRDALGKLQYGSIPMNGGPVILYGSH